jgi:hypothetical protein
MMSDYCAGDWVEVLSKEEILATLDERGRLDQLPFMPEMFAYCGQRFRVFKRAHKTCDTVNKTGGRRMPDTVHLEGVRCGGEAHGGCQAACLVFWKEAWLRRVDGPGDAAAAPRGAGPTGGGRCTEQTVIAAAETGGSEDVTYVCQATALPEATRLLPWWDLRQYVEDCTSRNVTALEVLGTAAYAVYTAVLQLGYRSRLPVRPLLERIDGMVRKLTGSPPFPEKRGARGPGATRPSPRSLPLHPGDAVRVKPHEEVLSTLDSNNKHRGMCFTTDDVTHCGRTFPVRSRVSKIVNERTGKMIHLKGNNFILEGAWCQSRYTDRRRLCPRAIYTFFREEWLESPTPASAAGPQIRNGAAPGSYDPGIARSGH